MRYLLMICLIAGCMLSCKHKEADPDAAYRSLFKDSMNLLKTGDSAIIYLAYPQGTAYYQYEFAEDSGRVSLLNHTTHKGNPDESGGGMSETFYIKAIKPGLDTIRIIDRSGAAMKAAADTAKQYQNYEMYVLKVSE